MSNYLYKGKDDDRPRQRTQRAHDLFDFLADRMADGSNLDEITRHFGWSNDQATEALRALRIILADGDTINVIGDPNGQGEQWTIRLVGTYDDARWYVSNRVGDLEARLDTMSGIAKSLEAASDGRTVEGKKAREIHIALRHLKEKLALLDA